MADYKAAPLASLPKTLDPNEYFNLSREYRQAEEERSAMRSNLKLQYQTQLNNPHRKALIEDPALTRWMYARSHTYPHFKATYKTSLSGFLFGVLPVLGFWYLFKTHRDQKEADIKAGKYVRRFALSS